MILLNTLIVDDERPAREVLRSLLISNFPGVNIVGEANNISEALKLIEEKKPNLLFLDIEVGDENIFDLVSKIKNETMEIIFITAHKSYALQAIRFSALDYILKPVTKEDLAITFEKLEKKKPYHNLQNYLELLAHNLDSSSKSIKKIALHIDNRIEIIPVNEIVRCEGDGNYTIFYLTGKRKLMVSKTMLEYEEILINSDFCRVHKSHLINLSHLKTYIRGEGGTAIMDDGSEVDVSRRKKEDLLKRL